jgi:hypothetical protein
MIPAPSTSTGVLVDVKINDFRIVDRVLAETEPEAADVVYLGARGRVAYPFVVVRTLAGPGGLYLDACDIIDADGKSLGSWEKRFELDGESKPRTLVTEIRDIEFPGPGTYSVQYFIFDEVLGTFTFTVVQGAAPAAGIVPGPLDAALSKSTIAWIQVEQADGKMVERPVWYGYEDGRVFVLVGGEDEQQIPGIFDTTMVNLLARSKDKRSKVAEAECVVEKLPKDAEWDRIARELLIGRRLNLTDGEAAVGRWKETCEIACLLPVPPRAETAEENAS